MNESKTENSKNAITVTAGCVWLSKKGIYERPYSVTGAIQRTGSKVAPKSVCERIKYRNVERAERRAVTCDEAVSWKQC